MIFDTVINSMSSEGKYKVNNQSNGFHVLGDESGILLIKTVLNEYGLQTHATIMKERTGLVNLIELMVILTYNVSKLNSQVISTTQNLKRKRYSA